MNRSRTIVRASVSEKLAASKLVADGLATMNHGCLFKVAQAAFFFGSRQSPVISLRLNLVHRWMAYQRALGSPRRRRFRLTSPILRFMASVLDRAQESRGELGTSDNSAIRQLQCRREYQPRV